MQLCEVGILVQVLHEFDLVLKVIGREIHVTHPASCVDAMNSAVRNAVVALDDVLFAMGGISDLLNDQCLDVRIVEN